MNIALLITHLLNGVLMISIPVGIGILIRRRFHLDWRLWLIGAAAFILSQVGHIPFNYALTSLFTSGVLPKPPEAYQLAFNAIVLGLSAGIWEEMANYAALRWWAKYARTWSKALMLGAGHGGIEAIIFGALVLVNYIVMIALRGTDLSALVPPEQLPLLTEGVGHYWSVPWYESLLGAVERLFAVLIQISLAVMVLQVFTRSKIIWLGAAIIWHAVVDATSVFVASTWGVYVAELTIGALAGISVVFIFLLRQPEKLPEGEPPLPTLSGETIQSLLGSPEITADHIEDSRYV